MKWNDRSGSLRRDRLPRSDFVRYWFEKIVEPFGPESINNTRWTGAVQSEAVKSFKERIYMCDYSLMSFPNRLATEGEELIVYRFPSGAKGLAAQSDVQKIVVPVPRKGWRPLLSGLRSLLREIGTPDSNKSVTAVCIPPGACLLLRDIPERLQSQVRVGRVEKVTFTQTTADAFSYRDAVRFRNGCEIILQLLQDGQRVRVLNLSSAGTASPELEWLTPAA